MIGNLFPQLPLLRRELTELANRRRTYVVRIAGAIILLSIIFVVLRTAIASVTAFGPGLGFGVIRRFVPGMGMGRGVPGGIVNILGIGGQIFPAVVPWMFRSIQLLMPGLCCSTITMEKERNTLGTLLLTRLSPFAIVLEKMGSRLIPMLTFLLLTFPVLAYVYSLGGVDTRLLASTLWLLLCECLLYASIGMVCSSWFRTTVSAFICSYTLVLVLQLSSTVLMRLSPTPYDIWRAEFMGDVTGMVAPGGMLTGLQTVAWGSQFSLLGVDLSTVLQLLVSTLPALVFSAVLLFLARLFLFRRAFVTSSSPLLRLFRVVDRFFVQLNERTTRGIELVKDTNTMPLFDPIAWRERTRKSLGKARYLFRVLTVLEVPTIFVCALASIASSTTGFSAMRMLLAMMWVLTILVLGVKGSTIISSERARETIEPLLSTPMTAAQIVEEKIVGMRRLMIVLSIPLLTIHVMLWQLLGAGLYSLVYLGLSIIGTANSLVLISWIAAGIGTRFQSQTRSLLGGIIFLAGWTVLPLMLSAFLWSISLSGGRMWYPSSGGLDLFSFFALIPLSVTPVGPTVMCELLLNSVGGWTMGSISPYSRLAESSGAVVTMAVTITGFQIVMLLVIRRIVLRVAPRLLNRHEDLRGARPAAAATLTQPAAI